MADEIDEAMLVAWIDGELDLGDAARVERAVAANPVLAARAVAHRGMKQRFAAAFGGLANEPVSLPKSKSAPIASLASARETRASANRWRIPVSLAASLAVGLIVGHFWQGPTGIDDRVHALELSPPVAAALDRKLSGEAGPVRVTLSFRDRHGVYCRSFAGANLSGIACRDGDRWALRYANPIGRQEGDYRMAGIDAVVSDVVSSMIQGDPLDAASETKARASHWR